MAENLDPKKVAREVGVVLQDALSSVADSIQDTVSRAFGDAQDVSSNMIKDISKGARDLAKVNDLSAKAQMKALEGGLRASEVQKIITDRTAKELALENSIEALKRNATDLTVEQQEALAQQQQDLTIIKKLNKEVEDSLNEQLEQSRKITDAQGLSGIALSGMEKLTSKIGLTGLSDVFTDAKQASTKAAQEVTDFGKNSAGVLGKFKVAGAGLKTAFSGGLKLLSGPGGILLALKLIVDVIKKVDGQTSKFAQSMNLSKREAGELSFELMKTSGALDNTAERLEDITRSMSEFADNTGIISTDSSIFTARFSALARFLGLSSEHMASLSKTFLAAGASSKEFMNNVMGSAKATMASVGINVTMQDIMKNIADTTNAQRLSLEANPVAIGKAVVQARKLGLTLTQLENSASGLLDFEQSIGAELEAELLTGRQLNLERARFAALTNDYTTLAQELSREIGTSAKFGKMSRIEQESFAKALNMSREEIADVLVEQEALQAAGYATAEERERDFNELVKTHGLSKAIREFGDQEYANLKARQSIMDQINNLLSNFGVIFVESIAPEVAKLAEFLSNNKGFINDMINGIKEFADTVRRVGTVIDALIVKPISAIANTLTGVIDLIGGGAKILGGDFAGGIQQAAQGFTDVSTAAGNVLDVGTNLIVGLTGKGQKDYFTDVGKGKMTLFGDEIEQTPMPSIQDGVIDPNKGLIVKAPKGSIQLDKNDSIVAGTNLSPNTSTDRNSEKTNQLLEKLIAAVERGGNVYMDSNKVGRSLVLGTYQSS